MTNEILLFPPKAAGTGIRLKRFFLILTAFISGAAVMVIELAANRVLTPWYGNSLYTWTGLIGIILIAMSGGYYLGGWLSEKNPRFTLLGYLLAGAGGLTMLIPVLKAVFNNGFDSGSPLWGPVVSSLLLFALPGLLLGAVSPFTIRLISMTTDDRHIGLSAGVIAMFSTLGSVAGTFASGFLLIPLLDLSTLFRSTGGILILLSIVSFVVLDGHRTSSARFAAVLLIITIGGILPWLPTISTAPLNLVWEKTSFYHRIRVFQDRLSNEDTLTSLMLDTTNEGARYDRDETIPVYYQRYWELATAFLPSIENAAFLGGGAYTMPIAVVRRYPTARVDVFEIDPEVVTVGRKFFGIGEFPAIHATAGDARRMLRLSDRRYDLIFGDAYNGIRCIPAHLLTEEFFQLVNSRLASGGIFMMNITSAVEGPSALLFQSVIKTLSGVFPHIRAFRASVMGTEDSGNIILAASGQDLTTSGNPLEMHPRTLGLLRTEIDLKTVNISAGERFSDQYNPVEYIVATRY